MRLNSVLLWLTASIGRNQTISWGGFVPPDPPLLLQLLGEGGGCRHRPQPPSFNKNKRLGEDVRIVDVRIAMGYLKMDFDWRQLLLLIL